MNKIPTELEKFPCPKCGEYFKPYMITSDGYAKMECPKHGLYRTSIKVSKNFRIFCSKLGSAPNRSPTYYTSLEKKIKKLLEKCGYREGIDYWHNCRVLNSNRKDRKIYYWLDFYIPKENLVIEANPRIWHNMWNRESSDNRKVKFLESIGLKVVVVNEKNYKDILKYLKWSRV